MNVDMFTSAAKSLTGALGLNGPSAIQSDDRKADAPFSGLMHDAASNLNDLEDKASATVEGLLGGTGVDIHAAMIATQKADLAFETALAVRGKAVAAYQTMMGIQF